MNQETPLNEAEIQAKQIKKELWQEKIMSFFDQLSFLEQTPEQKQAIAIRVKEDLNTGKLYWLEIILSSIIATFGLLQNSVAVIIGAMLIAPLLLPIQGIAYGIAEGDSKLIIKGIKLLVGSIIISILISYLVVFCLPIQTETSEILSRTSPNIFDLFIAISSAIIALLALSFKKLSESVAGVAMAASLMPPLSVVGIELALGSFTKAWGGLLLFFTNIIAILFVGALVFIFYGFRPHKKDSEKTAKDIVFLTVIILALIIPLVSGLTKITQKIELEAQSKKIITKILSEKIPAAEVGSIELQRNSENDTLNLVGSIKLPENISFFREIIDETTNELSNQLHKKIQLDLDIIRTARITSRQNQSPLKSQIQQAIQQVFHSHVSDGVLVQLHITKHPQKPNTWSAKMIYTIANNGVIEPDEKSVLETYINKKFPQLQIQYWWTQLAESQYIPPSLRFIPLPKNDTPLESTESQKIN
ncbi:TIGR00341 family protein [bacterium DOLZORAL124_38_8]|nr:MAG: TIGR00341 family protein [bacterium DOLZORAL124_38_8]